MTANPFADAVRELLGPQEGEALLGARTQKKSSISNTTTPLKQPAPEAIVKALGVAATTQKDTEILGDILDKRGHGHAKVLSVRYNVATVLCPTAHTHVLHIDNEQVLAAARGRGVHLEALRIRAQ